MCDFLLVRRYGLFRIFRIFQVRSFQYFWNVGKAGVTDDLHEGISTDMTFAKIFVPVFPCTPLIFTVVDVENGNLVKPDYPVKFCHHTLVVTDEVVSGIIDVACVEADAKFFRVITAVVDCF